MMNASAATPSQFDETLKNSVAVISHVWSQVNALKGKLDADLPNALRSEGVRLGEKLEDEIDCVDSVESLMSAWKWGYSISIAPKGRPKRIGWIYVLVRIAPVGNDDVQNLTFVPHISMHLAHRDCDEAGLEDLPTADFYTDDDMVADGWKLMSKPPFPAATLGYFKREDREGLWAVAAHIPLKILRSENLENMLVKPFSKLAGYCREEWSK